jgi:uncharacterized protein (DUF433 family)
MSATMAYPHIEKSAGQPAHLQRLPRIRVAQIAMDHLAHAWSAEEICRQYPHLRPSEVYAAMAYYFDNQDEIDSEIRAEWRQSQDERSKSSPSPLCLRLRGQGLV